MEIVIMTRFNKEVEEYVNVIYPKIGGRLRLAHEENEQLSITTEVVKNEEQLAVVRAVATTVKGSFTGVGMASVERDEKIAPAILELAETRAIARALRFAGFGVEYCSAEEVSHLENGNHSSPGAGNNREAIYCGNQGNGGNHTNGTGNKSGNGGNSSSGNGHKKGNGGNGSNGNGNKPGNEGNGSNGNGRLSAKQHSLALSRII